MVKKCQICCFFTSSSIYRIFLYGEMRIPVFGRAHAISTLCSLSLSPPGKEKGGGVNDRPDGYRVRSTFPPASMSTPLSSFPTHPPSFFNPSATTHNLLSLLSLSVSSQPTPSKLSLLPSVFSPGAREKEKIPPLKWGATWLLQH